jgi:hypothetical protein
VTFNSIQEILDPLITKGIRKNNRTGAEDEKESEKF